VVLKIKAEFTSPGCFIWSILVSFSLWHCCHMYVTALYCTLHTLHNSTRRFVHVRLHSNRTQRTEEKSSGKWKKNAGHWKLQHFHATFFSNNAFFVCSFSIHSNLIRLLTKCHKNAELINVKGITLRRRVMLSWPRNVVRSVWEYNVSKRGPAKLCFKDSLYMKYFRNVCREEMGAGNVGLFLTQMLF
jgi:hypothetical protein